MYIRIKQGLSLRKNLIFFNLRLFYKFRGAKSLAKQVSFHLYVACYFFEFFA